MRSVRVSWGTAQALLDLAIEYGGQDFALIVAGLRVAMRPKRSVKAAKTRRVAKRLTKKEKTAAVRELVMERAGGNCEMCGGRDSTYNPLALDHFFGRARAETVETCWALCFQCHREKTDNNPSAEFWLQAFIRHAESYGYLDATGNARRRLDSLRLQSLGDELRMREAVASAKLAGGEP